MKRLLGFVASVLSAMSAAKGQDAPTGFDAVRIQLDAAWKRNDQPAIEQGLRSAIEADARRGADFAFGVITNGTPAMRPVGASVIAKYVDGRGLASSARALSRVNYPDERRLFVRMLAKHAKEDGVYDAAAEFLQDQDMMVRASAITVLAATGRPEAIGLIMRSLDIPPAYASSYGDQDRDIVNMAAYGAVHALTDLTPERSNDVIVWWNGLNGATPPPPPSWPAPEALEKYFHEAKLQEGRWRGRPFFASPSFHIQTLVKGMPTVPVTGSPDWRDFGSMSEESMAMSREMFDAVTGPAILPPVRLLICDDQNYVANAGSTFFAGNSTANEVVVRAGPIAAMRTVLTHECVHIRQTALFRNQPRWLLEGMAMSLTGSVNGSTWTNQRVREANIDSVVERGLFTDVFGWVSSGSSDSREGERYAASYLAIDFLRFWGFAAPDTRLAFLMGRVSRYEAPRQAVEALYGVRIGDLDRWVKEWIRAR